MANIDTVNNHVQQTPPPEPPPPPPPPHEVQRGETVDQLAARYRVQPDQVTQANPRMGNPDAINPGDQLNLPEGAQAPALHQVQQGETLDSIAAQYPHAQTDASEIAHANGITNPNVIRAGDEVWVPGAGDASAPHTGQQEPVLVNPVDVAVSNLQGANQTLQSVQDQAATGDGAARAELNAGSLHENVHQAEEALKGAVIDEITSRAGALPGQNAIAQVGNDIAGRYSDQGVRNVIGEAVSDYQAQQGVDDALRRLNAAQDALGTVQASADRGDGAASAEIDAGYLQQNVSDAQQRLQSAIGHEIERTWGSEPTPATVAQMSNDIANRYANNPAAQTAICDAASQLQVDRAVDQTLDAAESASSPRAQLEALNQGLLDGSPQVQSELLADPRTTAIIDEAARYANEPLGRIPADIQSEHDVHPQTNEAVTRLDELIQGLDARITAGVVNSALPQYEDVLQRFEHFPVFGQNGTHTAVEIAGRVWSAPGGDQLVQRIVGLGTSNAMGLMDPLYQGAGPAYLLELGQQPGVSMPGGGSMFDASIAGVTGFRDGQVTDSANAYIEHIEELGFLTQNGGAAMTPEQLDEAIREYVASKGPEWEQTLNDLQTQLANDGAQLLSQVQQLASGLANVPADQQAGYRQQIAEILSNPHAELAASMALRQQPELARGASGERLVQTFAELGITGADNPLATSLVSSYLRENVMAPSANIDFTNPTSLQEARGALTDALRDNAHLAQVLEISPDQLNEVADTMIDLVPRSSANLNAFDYANNVARNSNNAFDKLDEALGRNTPFNLAFRTSAVGIVGSGLVNAIDTFGEHPTLRNGLDVFVESARVGVDGGQLIAAARELPASSSSVSTLKAAGKFVHVLGAGLAAYDAVGRLQQGDYTGAGLNAAVAGGVAYGALGSSAWAGPIGFGVAAVASAGLFIYDSIRTAQHNNRFQTETTTNFLQDDSLFNPEAARVLTDQSGEGYSPIPILMKYGEMRGLTPQQTVDWVNSIDEHRLAALRDNLHQTLDEIDGDLSRFNATANDDNFVVRDTHDRPWFAASGVAQPESAAQLDAILDVLEIARPS